MPNDFVSRLTAAVGEALLQCTRNPAASRELVSQVEAELGVKLPEELVAFYLESNGISGRLGKSFLEIEPVEGILARSADYDFPEVAPQWLLFGTNGGSEGFAVDRRTGVIVLVPLIDPKEEDAIQQGNFCQFLARVAADEQFT